MIGVFGSGLLACSVLWCVESKVPCGEPLGGDAADSIEAPRDRGGRSTDPKDDVRDVTIGVWLNAIPVVDLKANSFRFDAYLWFRWDPSQWGTSEGDGDGSAAESPATTFELVDAVSLEKEVLFESDGYSCLHITGERLSFWNVTDYPFDEQVIELVFEDGALEVDKLRYIADARNSGVGSQVRIGGAVLGATQMTVAPYSYETTFGDPEMSEGANSRYSRLTFGVPVKRDSGTLFLKLFSGLFVSASIAMLALFINPTQVDPRFGLCVGGLFGTVASNYMVSSLLPDASGFCYSDSLHIAALTCILVVVLESAWALHLHLTGGDAGAERGRKFDRWTFGGLAAGATAVVVLVTLAAVA